VSQNIRDASRFISLITVIIGPFIASVIGVIVGFVCGVYIVYRKRKKLERLTTA
jgi:ABC-type nitrate/sulfonate/bicarbonate transport system permease component